MSKWIPAEEIPEGEGRCYDIDGEHVAVFNKGGTYYAMKGKCPNAQDGLEAQGSLDKVIENCPNKDWQFDMHTGPCSFEPSAVQELQTSDSQARWWEGRAPDREVEVRKPGE